MDDKRGPPQGMVHSHRLMWGWEHWALIPLNIACSESSPLSRVQELPLPASTNAFTKKPKTQNQKNKTNSGWLHKKWWIHRGCQLSSRQPPAPFASGLIKRTLLWWGQSGEKEAQLQEEVHPCMLSDPELDYSVLMQSEAGECSWGIGSRGWLERWIVPNAVMWGCCALSIWVPQHSYNEV